MKKNNMIFVICSMAMFFTFTLTPTSAFAFPIAVAAPVITKTLAAIGFGSMLGGISVIAGGSFAIGVTVTYFWSKLRK